MTKSESHQPMEGYADRLPRTQWFKDRGEIDGFRRDELFGMICGYLYAGRACCLYCAA